MDIDQWKVLVAEYLAERTARRDLGRDTVKLYRSTLLRFVRLVGEHDLDADMILEWLELNRDIAPGTLRTNMGILRKFTQWCQVSGHIVMDPMVLYPAPKVPRAVPRALDGDELVRLWAVLPDERARLICALALGLGLRRAEIAGLELGDWDRFLAVLTVRHLSKGGHQRVLPIPEHVGACLNAYMKVRPVGAGTLVRSYRRPSHGVLPQQIGKLMTEWMLDAGVKDASWDGKSTHALRHSFAQMLYRLGGDHDLRLVQAALGHSHLSSTEIYMRTTIDTERLRTALAHAQVGAGLSVA